MRAAVKSHPRALFVIIIVAVLAGCGGNNSGGGNNSITPPPILTYSSVVVNDLNRDGKLDIAGALESTSTSSDGTVTIREYVIVYLQDPANPGKFLSPVRYDLGGVGAAVSIAAGDLNGDGQPDLVTADMGSGSVSVLLQDGTGSGHFLPAVTYAAGAGAASVAIGDLNGDGKPDIAVAGYGVQVLFQNPNSPGKFLSPTTFHIPWNAPNSVTIADLNGDGYADLIAPTVSQVAVFLQNPALPGNFFSATGYDAGQQPWGAAVGDLNGDGRPDIAVANYGPPNQRSGTSVSVLLQNPAVSGTFLTPANYATDRVSMVVQIGDLDGDGRPDLAVANNGAVLTTCPPNCDSVGSSVSVLLQDPANPGTFLPSTNYSTTKPVGSVAIGDMNGDGKADLVLSYEDSIVIRFQDPNAPGKFLDASAITN